MTGSLVVRLGSGIAEVIQQMHANRHTLATVAFQTIYGAQQRQRSAKGSPPGAAGSAKRPAFIDTCHALAADGDVVKTSWPEFYQPKR